ncbi:hypothetical protein HWV62_17726 [Athelia sp. TMB]|nr:hypothetical protein HWV62_17726 [Athelia sp. TMB]
MGCTAHLFTWSVQQEEPLDLTPYVKLMENGENFLACGSFGDVCRANLEIDSYRNFVAVKYVRLHNQSPEAHNRLKIASTLASLPCFASLIHLEGPMLLGTTCQDKWIGMVSPWVASGDLHTAVRKTDLALSHRLQLACDTAEVHAQNIIHGDLTGKNILVNNEGTACIIDFGLSVIQMEFEGTHYLTSTIGGALRYRAPELMPGISIQDLTNFKPKLTPACDVWSLGCIVLQILTGEVPYREIPDVCLMLAILRGTRPSRLPAAHLDDNYWNYINTMWGKTPRSRPTVDDASKVLARLRASALDSQ